MLSGRGAGVAAVEKLPPSQAAGESVVKILEREFQLMRGGGGGGEIEELSI